MYVGAPEVNLLFNVFVCGVAVPRGHRQAVHISREVLKENPKDVGLDIKLRVGFANRGECCGGRGNSRKVTQARPR
jgi:hypothetical protein